MAVKIPGKVPGVRVRQVLSDPKTYFAGARRRARAEILAERQEARLALARQRRRKS